LLVSSLSYSDKAWQAHTHTQQTELPLPHNICGFTSNLCACPSSSASIECTFSTYGLLWSDIRNSLGAEKAEKLVKIYRHYRAEKDNHLNLLQLLRLFSF